MDFSWRAHILIPAVIATICFLLLFLFRKQILNNWKWTKIGFLILFGLYASMLSIVIYRDISLQIALNELDLNGDGFFNGSELTDESRKAMDDLSSDTGRNFAPFTAAIFSALIAFVVASTGRIIALRKSRIKAIFRNQQ